jgi:hypothetical protein
MYTIKQVVGEDILIRYNNLKVQINAALEYSSGEWTAAQIVARAISEPDMFHIWEVLKDGSPIAIGTTRVIHYNNFTSLHIMTLGGIDVYEEMPALIMQFEEMTKEHDNIDCLEFTGRRGFVKQLTKVGWTERYTTMRKSLKEDLNV